MIEANNTGVCVIDRLLFGEPERTLAHKEKPHKHFKRTGGSLRFNRLQFSPQLPSVSQSTRGFQLPRHFSPAPHFTVDKRSQQIRRRPLPWGRFQDLPQHGGEGKHLARGLRGRKSGCLLWAIRKKDKNWQPWIRARSFPAFISVT